MSDFEREDIVAALDAADRMGGCERDCSCVNQPCGFKHSTMPEKAMAAALAAALKSKASRECHASVRHTVNAWHSDKVGA